MFCFKMTVSSLIISCGVADSGVSNLLCPTVVEPLLGQGWRDGGTATNPLEEFMETCDRKQQ